MSYADMTVLEWANKEAQDHGWTVIESSAVPHGEILVDQVQQTVLVNPSAATWTVGMNASAPLLPTTQGPR